MWPLLVRSAVRLLAPKWTVGALGLLANQRGEILLVRHRGRSYPWGLPGGMLKHPETPTEGLCRELQEELALALDEELLAIHPPLTATKLPLLELIYSYGKPLSDNDILNIKTQRIEIAELKWVNAQTLALQEGILPRHRTLVDRFLRSAAGSPKEFNTHT